MRYIEEKLTFINIIFIYVFTDICLACIYIGQVTKRPTNNVTKCSVRRAYTFRRVITVYFDCFIIHSPSQVVFREDLSFSIIKLL